MSHRYGQYNYERDKKAVKKAIKRVIVDRGCEEWEYEDEIKISEKCKAVIKIKVEVYTDERVENKRAEDEELEIIRGKPISDIDTKEVLE